MEKEKKGGKLIIAVGVTTACVVTVGAFFRKNIIYKYYEYSVNKNYSSTNIKVNDYYLEDNFEYVNDYADTCIKNIRHMVVMLISLQAIMARNLKMLFLL